MTCGPGHAQAEQEPAAGQVGQRHRGLRDRDRRAGADLDHARAQQHGLGAGREVARAARARPRPRPRPPSRRPGRASRPRRRTRRLSFPAEPSMVVAVRITHGPFGHLLDGGQVVLQAGLPFPQPDEDDLLLLVRHRVDGQAQAGAGRAHPRPLLEHRARPVGPQGEPPGRHRVAGVAHRPGEPARLVALDDRADRLPRAAVRVGVAAGEPVPDGRAGDLVQPGHLLQLGAQPRHQEDVAHQSATPAPAEPRCRSGPPPPGCRRIPVPSTP